MSDEKSYHLSKAEIDDLAAVAFQLGVSVAEHISERGIGAGRTLEVLREIGNGELTLTPSATEIPEDVISRFPPEVDDVLSAGFAHMRETDRALAEMILCSMGE